jgi:hypothetical protein
MLRLTRVLHEDSGVTLIVEGRIVAEWVDLLIRECTRLQGTRRPICLDLSRVTYVDVRGAAQVRRLVADGIRLTPSHGLVAELLEEDEHD